MGCLGTLEIELKRRRGCDFHTLDILFAGMISRLDLLIDFLQILEIIDSFWLSVWKRFGHEILGIISQKSSRQ